MDSEQMVKLAAALELKRDEVVREASQQIAYLNGKIDLLRELAKAQDAKIDLPDLTLDTTA